MPVISFCIVLPLHSGARVLLYIYQTQNASDKGGETS